MTLSEWKNSGKYFNYKGQQIFYREGGQGETLLLLHGFPTASWDWHRTWPALTAHFHVLAPDMIGFGFSAKPRKYHYCLHDQADLFEVMAARMGIHRAHILAHDYGDTVAQELLARWLDRRGNHVQALDLQSVSLLNGGLFPDMHHPRAIQKVLASSVGSFLVPFLGKRQLGNTFREIFGENTQPTAAEIDDFWHLIEFNDGKALIPRHLRYLHERRQYQTRWVGALEKCPLPLLHLNGTDDPISGRHAGEHFKKLVPQVEVRFLEGIGHYPQVEAPAVVAREFLSFLKK